MRIMRVITLATVVAFGVSSCATVTSSSDDPCNIFVAGAAGAAVGGATGAAVGSGNRWAQAALGAVIGAAVGAATCLAINSHSKQTKTAEQVEADVKRQNRGQLPATPSLLSYSATISPDGVVKPGVEIVVASNIEVVNGQVETIRDIKETITLIGVEGKALTTHEKKVAEGNPGSGAFHNTFGITLPNNAPLGVYTFRTQVYVNDNPTRMIDNRVQLAMVGDRYTVALVAAH